MLLICGGIFIFGVWKRVVGSEMRKVGAKEVVDESMQKSDDGNWKIAFKEFWLRTENGDKKM